MKFRSSKLLLVDGLGAMLSALGLVIIIPTFHSYFNVPIDVLHILAGIAATFSFYSLVSYLLSAEQWRKYLRVIAMANLCYCVLTIALLVKFLEVISGHAIAYFAGEILLVVCLSILELKVAHQK